MNALVLFRNNSNHDESLMILSPNLSRATRRGSGRLFEDVMSRWTTFTLALDNQCVLCRIQFLQNQSEQKQRIERRNQAKINGKAYRNQSRKFATGKFRTLVRICVTTVLLFGRLIIVGILQVKRQAVRKISDQPRRKNSKTFLDSKNESRQTNLIISHRSHMHSSEDFRALKNPN